MEDAGLTESKALVLRQLVPLYRGKTVLDLGCFDGRWAALCLKFGAKRAIGVDNLAYTQEHSVDPYYGRSEPSKMADERVEFIAADAETADLPNVDFTIGYDVIFCFNDPLVFLTRLRAKTKALLCTFVVTDVGGATENPGYVAVRHKYTLSEAQNLLVKAGFKPSLVYGILDRAFFLAIPFSPDRTPHCGQCGCAVPIHSKDCPVRPIEIA